MIQSNKPFDFQDVELITHLQSAAIGDQFDVQNTPLNDFHFTTLPAKVIGLIPGSNGALIVPWTLIQHWAIDEIGTSGPQRVQKFNIETTVWRQIEVKVCVGLVVLNGTDPDMEVKICNAYTTYQFPQSGDVDNYVKKFLSSYPDINPYAFGLVYYYRIHVLSDRITDNSQLHNIISRLNDNKYRLTLINQSELKSLRPRLPNPNIKEEEDSSIAVHKVANENMPKYGCDGLTTDFKEFSRMDTVPDSRLQWGWHLVSIGCAKFHLYYPITQVREKELVASVYWTFPRQLDTYVRSIVENCAKESAIASIVSSLVFTDVESSLVGFKALFWQCLRSKLGQTLSCLDVGLVVNERTKPGADWH